MSDNLNPKKNINQDLMLRLKLSYRDGEYNDFLKMGTITALLEAKYLVLNHKFYLNYYLVFC